MIEDNPPLLFVLGPTAVGKTEVALTLAGELGGEIVSADSMQIYRGMDIGTAKPSPEERSRVPHHLIDIMEISDMCDVGRFRELAFAAIRDIQARGRCAIVTGGSGMYVRALTQGLLEGPGRDAVAREGWEQLESSDLRQHLLLADPDAAAKIDPKDRRRMVRALEFYAATGTPISSRQRQWGKDAVKNAFKNLFYLHRPRQELYQRSDLRVEKMFRSGWIDEVRTLMERGLEDAPTAAKAIGYREVIMHVKGRAGKKETIALIQQKTRNFVKRQLTWFRKEPNLRWLDLESGETTEHIAARIRQEMTRES